MFGKKSIKKFIAALITIVLYVSILPNFTMQAADSALNVSASSNSIQRGGTVDVVVGISSDASFKSGQFNFIFDTSAFDYLSCVSSKDGVSASFANSVVSVDSSSNINGDATKVDILKIILKAKISAEIKNYVISLENGTFSNMSGINVDFIPANLTLAVASSSNTNIKSVTIGGKPVTSTLSHNLENGIAYAQILVVPEDGTSTVKFINPNLNSLGFFVFAVGDNVVPFIITAQDGTAKTYEIKVNRAGNGQTPATAIINPTSSVQPTSIVIPSQTSSSSGPNSSSTPSGSGSKLNSSTPGDTAKKSEGGISALAAFFWIIVSLVIGIWIGIFIGYMWWGKKRSTRLFRY